MLASQNGILHDEAEWFLSLAYLKSGDITKGKTLLQKIVNTKSWLYKKATEILEAL